MNIDSLVRKILKQDELLDKENYVESNPHITCMTTKSAIYYAIHKGIDALELVNELTKVTYIPFSYLINEDNWINLKDCINVMDKCCEAMGLDPSERESYKEIGRSSLRLGALNKSLLFIPFVIGGPQDVIEYTILFSKQFEKYMNTSVFKEDDKLIVRSSYKNGLEEITRCEWEEGLFESIPTYFGYEPFNVHQRKCVRHNPKDNFCEYEIPLILDRDKSASFKSRLRGFLADKIPKTFNLKNAFYEYNQGLVSALGETQNALQEVSRRSEIFETFTSSLLVKKVDLGEDPRQYVPEEIEASILFSDIRDFTLLTKNMNPTEIIEFLNTYNRYVQVPIFNNGGEIDKLIGDAVMAYFQNDDGKLNGPDNSVNAAIEIKNELINYNRSFAKLLNKQIESGVGINYGKVVRGNVGYEKKKDNTLIGNPVNISSRLESLTKHYHVGIIISEAVKDKLVVEHDVRFLDKIRVKGDGDSVINIYEVFDYEPEFIKEKKYSLQSLYDEAFEAYNSGKFGESLNLYLDIEKNLDVHKWIEGYPLDPLILFYKERINNLLIRKEKDSIGLWDGVHVFNHK